MATTAYATCPQCRMPGADSAESTHAFCGREARAVSRLFVEHCEAVAAKINITRRWLGEQ